MRLISFAAMTLMAITSFGATAAEDIANQESACDIAVQDSEGTVSYMMSKDLEVLNSTAINTHFRINEPDDLKVLAIKCYRTDIVPTENDYKVVEAGYRLYIAVAVEDEESADRISAIDKTDGKFHVRMAAGEMTKSEKKRADKLVKWLNDGS